MGGSGRKIGAAPGTAAPPSDVASTSRSVVAPEGRAVASLPSVESLAPPPTPAFEAPCRTGDVGQRNSVFGLRLQGFEGKKSVFKTPEFQLEVDTATNSRLHTQTKLELLFDGVNSFRKREELIQNAKQNIHLQTFIFTDDNTGWNVARQLAAKAQEGVKVRVIYDALGSNRSERKIFDFMREAGVEVRAYAPLFKQPWKINSRWHEKQLIVDGESAIVGGMNIADEYALGGSGRKLIRKGTSHGVEPWRDVDLLVRGSVVADAQQRFLENWSALGADLEDHELEQCFPPVGEPVGEMTSRFVRHDPRGAKDENTEQLYLKAIEAAESSIAIESAYFIPGKRIREALAAAARRGVKVRIMTNSTSSTDMAFVSEAARYYYPELLEAGVEVYERFGSTLHSKSASFDGEYAIVGSCNLNGRSENCDTECVIATSEAGIARKLDVRFEQGLIKAKQVSLEELEAEPFYRNMGQFALSCFSGIM